MRRRTRVKICGITQYCDIPSIIAQGVDALGFIFVKSSPRYIEPEVARDLIRLLPPFVDTVGVFMNEDPDEVNDIAQYCGLSFVQLHGSEPPQYCESINAPVIKALRVEGKDSLVFDLYRDVVKGFLLDTYQKDKAGGTGKTFDWQLLKGAGGPADVILAGGLTPENVGEAIKTVRPYAVDINSGVESSPGRKDVALITRLVDEVCRTYE